MASHLPLLTSISLILFLALALTLTPSHSALTCAPPKVPSNRTFANCTALSTLGATLHYTYNATNRTLAVAFAAAPPSPSGWVAWGLNLVRLGMVGTEAIIAFPLDSAVNASRYNITSYKSLEPVKAFSFESWDVSAEHANGVTTIYATVKIPEKAANVSHVWQVGPVQGGSLRIHGTNPENLNSREPLPVKVDASSGNATATAPAPASGEKSAAGDRVHFELVVAFIVALFVMSAFLGSKAKLKTAKQGRLSVDDALHHADMSESISALDHID
ncbi:hypothetical protein Fmac_028464 [Flemingia macrophylla]|uniref:DOMON domain-containing protein n=1 Tax=Flemingia macrophylla TaxID=520843 RepID=A0ABD1L7K5_9FABA